MVNQYSMGTYPQAYPQMSSQAYPQMYPQEGSGQITPQRSSSPSTVGAMALGAVGGGGVGYWMNRYPVGKDGNVSDSFAKEVLNNHIKKNLSSTEKEFFKQVDNVLAQIDQIKDVEGLKSLLNKNKMVLDGKMTGLSLDTFVNSLNSDNLKKSKKSLKTVLENGDMANRQIFKNYAEKCWDKDAKKFVKPDNLDSKIFDVIKKTKSKNQWKKALKYGGITAGVLGALTIGYKMFVGYNRPRV